MAPPLQRLWFLPEGLRRQQLICCLWTPPLTQKHMKELVSHQASTPTHQDRPPPEQVDLWAPLQSFSAQRQHAYLLCINPPRHHAGACANSVGVEDTISLPFLIALTGCCVCAALSTHAGRNQRSLPDKRARRKPGWLDNTVDPKQAAQLALQQAAADVSLDVALLCHCTCCSPLPCKPCCCRCAAAVVLCCCCALLLLLCSAAAVLCCCRCCSAAILLLGGYDASTPHVATVC